MVSHVQRYTLRVLTAFLSLVTTIFLIEGVLQASAFPVPPLPFSWITEDHPLSIYEMSWNTIWSHVPDQDITIHFTAAVQRHRTDLLGNRTIFRNARDEVKHPTHIILVGDSYIYGDIVNNDQTVASYLQSALDERGYNHYKVINAGVSGYGPDQQYRLLEQHLQRIYPQSIVIWALSHNDRVDTLERTLVLTQGDRIYSFPGAVHGMFWGGLIHRHVLKHIPHSKLAHILTAGLVRVNPLGIIYQADPESFQNTLSVMVKSLEQSEKAVVVTQVPNLGYHSPLPEYATYRKEILSVRDLENKVTYYFDSNEYIEKHLPKDTSLEDLFLTDQEDATMPYGAKHLSAKGSRYYAGLLFDYLENHRIVTQR